MGGMFSRAALGAAIASLVVAAWAPPSWAGELREAVVLEAVARAAALKHGVGRADVMVRWMDRPAAQLAAGLPEGPVSVEVLGTARMHGQGAVGISVDVAGRRWRSIFPKVEIQVMVPALVAVGPIPRGSVVSEQQVQWTKVALPPSGLRPAATLAQVVGSEALRDLSAGEALAAHQFRAVPAVRAGELVNVVLQAGDLTLQSTGQARSAGPVGAMVRVILTSTRKELVAKVVAPGKVLIEMEEGP